MRKLVNSFISNSDGAVAIEYALLASLIALPIIGTVGGLGTKLSGDFAVVEAAFK
jgi:pilus assembly protein Flp/PilA